MSVESIPLYIQSAHIAALAYEPDVAAMLKSPHWDGAKLDADSIEIYTTGIDSAFTAKTTEGREVVAFRGTVENSILDWLNDDRIEMTQFGYGNAHAGFVASFMNLWKAGAYTATSADVLLIGHSKGAALAGMTAEAMSDQTPTVITFGEPRWCDAQFAAAYSADHTRIVNRRDPVPDLPWEVTGYRHVGNVVDVGDGGLVPEISHHFLASYLEALSSSQVSKGITL